MKICHLTSVHHYPDPRIFFKQCRSLAAFGHEVHLVTTGAEDGERDGVRVHGVAAAKGGRLSRFTGTMRRVYREAIRIDADAYHFHDPELIPVGLLLKRRGKAVLYDVHEDVPRDIMLKKWIPRPIRGLVSAGVARLEAFAARRFDAIVTATPKINERFQTYNPRSVNLNNFPLLEELKFTGEFSDKRDDTICYVGYITEIRGIFQMVEAVGKAEARLLLGGKFSYPEERRRAGELPGWERVEYIGWLGRDEVARTLSAASAGLVVLHPTDTFVESLPVKLFEYMAAGIPVIASHFPLWKQIVEGSDCGICVDPLNADDIAWAIRRIVANPEEARRLGRNGREAAERRYNWEQEALKLRRLYDHLQARLGGGAETSGEAEREVAAVSASALEPGAATAGPAPASPAVTVTIPVFNEAKHIRAALTSVALQDYSGPIEMVVVDGASTDGTADIVREIAASLPPSRTLRLLRNESRHIPVSLNMACAAAGADLLLRLDGHSIAPPGWVRETVATLARFDYKGVCGGRWQIEPGADTTQAAAIAAGVSHRFGIGGALYRVHDGGDNALQHVDTVPFGCFAADVWRKLNGYDETLLADEDTDFNFRARQKGLPMTLNPAIVFRYFARPTLRALGKQYGRYGFWSAKSLLKHKRPPSPRKLAPIGLIAALAALTALDVRLGAALLLLYAAAATGAACAEAAARGRGLVFALRLACVFPVLHFAYGFGNLAGYLSALRPRFGRKSRMPHAESVSARGRSSESNL
ncbi:glycosyltransferase [Paenibacillus cymbidii]|uniref:glycosyltransferase n=1 Tax=Paenibacillus cymbidii TaxID=1639034 RepID=UPI0014369BD3|nr:glycosyltransferase [Paenibacillus cymbidii]